MLLRHVHQPAFREHQRASRFTTSQRMQVLSCALMPTLVTSSVEGHLSMSASASQEPVLPLQDPSGVRKPGCEARDPKDTLDL